MSNLKYFVRLDASGRVVPGSLVARKIQPKNGRWKEIDGTECCGKLGVPVISANTITATGFIVDWADITGATNYQIQIATDQSFNNVVAASFPSASTYTATGLTTATKYYVRVRSLDAKADSKDSAYSATLLVTTV